MFCNLKNGSEALIPKARPSAAEKFTISEMSAPATNDFSPAPVRITTLMSSLPSISVRTSFNSVSVSLFRAFNAFGLLIVSTAIGLLLLKVNYSFQIPPVLVNVRSESF